MLTDPPSHRTNAGRHPPNCLRPPHAPDRTICVLMGDNVEDRLLFIEENAVNVKNLDV